MKRINQMTIVVFAISFLLTSCGGGGGGSSQAPDRLSQTDSSSDSTSSSSNNNEDRGTENPPVTEESFSQVVTSLMHADEDSEPMDIMAKNMIMDADDEENAFSGLMIGIDSQ